METRNITIQGLVFAAPVRYAAGHVLTEIEAKVLNQTLAENGRNNYATVVKAAIEKAGGLDALKADDAAMQELHRGFSDYMEEYTFATGPGRGPRASVDPIEAEAFKLAKEAVLKRLRETEWKVGKGGVITKNGKTLAKTVTDYTADKMEKDGETFRAAAAEILAVKGQTVETAEAGDEEDPFA